MTPNPLASFVAHVMLERKLKLSDVARRGGLSVATVAAIRAGQRGKRPRSSTLVALAHGLDVPVAAVTELAGVTDDLDLRPSRQEHRLVSAYWQLGADDREVVDRLVVELLRLRRRRLRAQR